MSFTFAHTPSSLSLEFYGEGLQHVTDESWAIDNVQVQADIVPEPATIAAMAIGLAALRRRRR